MLRLSVLRTETLAKKCSKYRGKQHSCTFHLEFHGNCFPSTLDMPFAAGILVRKTENLNTLTPNPTNGQTHSNKLLAIADESFLSVFDYFLGLAFKILTLNCHTS